ncbi:RagB/SusD family nutrient uptake outer membrane protein [Pedobacter miscanthi]|uniref:RagB/SusD family nutrient uptake outer membrane protein n=1 Tax=Pedobacter miscanthi TaxID=2259170 RepID=A0A366LDH7_9SPHI|nr:RagB/SusD family nutrient uptake outer membrane protein [Pedobacter miscanthi]RBQ11324.1 RagB/SusD family nutrient uptake outer membrane protein [Pedobacter miscanthi]
MKKNIFYPILAFVLLLVAGCKKDDFLQDGSFSGTNDITEAQLWANPDYARNFLNNVYSVVSDRYNLGDGALLASGTDEAVNSNLNASISTINNGTWSPVRTFDDVYVDMYVGIRKANMFLEKIDAAAIVPIDEVLPANVAENQTLASQIERLKGQAYFLRAFFEFELLKRYGSFAIVTKTLTINDKLDVPRNTFDQCVAQISADCESAISLLPLSPSEWNTTNRGRATKTSAMALKSRMLLYAASPQYNPTNDVTKWQAALDAAKRVMDTGKHGIYSSYPNIWLWNVSGAAYNTEVIFATQTLNTNSIESTNAPVSYDGATGRTNPTQEMVDAFEMKTTGRPITDAASGYSATAPYTNRDPRLNFAVMYNGSTFKSKPVETFVGGKDGLGLNVNATKTGYYMRKYLSESAVWAGTATNIRRPWILFRYAEILLNYAEAVNEVQGVAGQTEVLRVLNLIRARTGVAMPALQTTNAAGNGYVAPTKDELRKRIHNERRVELCFEEHRFYDVRRWKEGEATFNKPVTGMRIVQLTPTTFSYTPFTVENRVFAVRNYLYPISQTELNKAPNLGQNPGYQ